MRQGPKARAGNRLLRILEHGISVVPLLATNPVAAEYSFEHIARVTASNDDPTELSMEILDTTKQSHGYDTLRFYCDSRSALLTVLFNRIDEVNGIGEYYFLSSQRECLFRGNLSSKRGLHCPVHLIFFWRDSTCIFLLLSIPPIH